MEESEYNEKLRKVEVDYRSAQQAIHLEYAKAQEKYKIGDIIKDNTKIILIDKITAYKSFGLPEPVYHGVELKKDLTPKKKGEIGYIYGNHLTELIKVA